MPTPPASNARTGGRRLRAAALGIALAGALTTTAAAPAGAVSISYVGLFAGPAVSDMYPVDVVDFGNYYYVVDPGRYAVHRVDRTTQQVLTRGGHQGRALGQFGAARAIAVDSVGRIYVADTPNNRVQRFPGDLSYPSPQYKSWGTTGTGPGQFSMVYGITVGMGIGPGGAPDTEVVYTTDGSRVQKFTTDGAFISQFGQGHLNQPRQLAVDPNTHNLYVVSARDREIAVFDPSGNELTGKRFGGEGTGNGKFMGDIRGIDIDDDGYVYVSDDGNHRVQMFTSNGAYLGQFGNTSPGSDQYLTDARGLTVTHDGIVCVADEWDYGLKEYAIEYTGPDPTGATFSRFMFGGAAPAPGFNSPRGITVNEIPGHPSYGAVYAVDWWNQRLEKFNSNGSFVKKWGQRGTKTEPGSINFAWDAAVNPANGNIYVANRESHEIEVFDANGNYVTRWGFRGTADGKFTFPQGVAFDPTNGTLLVADSGNGRIQRFQILASGKGSWKASYGTKGAGSGQFSVPTGIDVAPDGTIWVADTQNNRIQKRNPTTGNWTSYTTASGLALGFKSPWGVTVGPDGSIWVADTGRDRVVEMSASGTLIATADKTTTGTGGSVGSMDAPFEVAFGVGGAIYVSVVWDNKIIELAAA